MAEAKVYVGARNKGNVLFGVMDIYLWALDENDEFRIVGLWDLGENGEWARLVPFGRFPVTVDG